MLPAGEARPCVLLLLLLFLCTLFPFPILDYLLYLLQLFKQLVGDNSGRIGSGGGGSGIRKGVDGGGDR